MGDPRKMFYGAGSKIFEIAKENRGNLTLGEKKLWQMLRRNQLGVKFRSQHPIGKYIADFYCHRYKLVIELDGCYHESKDQKLLDQIREEIMQSYGISVLRFTNEAVNLDLDKVVEEIKEFVEKLRK